jgi:general secretion pathway protein G
LSRGHDGDALGKRKRQKRAHGEGGFTLIEILVVIAIIALIMSLVGPRVLNYLGESKVKDAKFKYRVLAARSICSISIPAVIRPRRKA